MIALVIVLISSSQTAVSTSAGVLGPIDNHARTTLSQARAAERAADRNPVFSPDGKTIAFIRSYPLGVYAGTALTLVGVNGRNLRTLTRQSALADPAWSPDGKSLAYAAGGNIWRIEVSDPHPVQLTNNPVNGTTYDKQPAWSPNGTQIAFSRIDLSVCDRDCPAVWLMNADGSDQHQLRPTGSRPQFSPDGSKLALSLSDALAIDLNGNTVVPGLGGYTTWSPHGDYLATTNTNQGVLLYNVETGSHRLLSGKIRQKPAWSPGAKYIAGGGFPGAVVTVIRTNNASHFVKLPHSTVLGGVPSWSPTGLLAYVHTGASKWIYCGIDLSNPAGTRIIHLTSTC